MKRFLYPLLVLLLFVTTSCEKDDSVTFPDPNLNGTWELRSEWGGWSGQSTFEAGNGNIYRFSGDSYEFIMSGVRRSGKYELQDDISILTDTPIKRIFFYDGQNKPSEEQAGRLHVAVENDTLTLAMDVYDGNTLKFIRVAP